MPQIEDRIGALLGDMDEPTPEPEQGQATEVVSADEREEEFDESKIDETSSDLTEEVKEDDDVEQVNITSLGELAQHLDTDVAELYNLKIPVTKADGTKAEVSIGEWKDAYRETDLIKSERTKFESEIAQVQEVLSTKAQALDTAYVQAEAMMQAAEKQLVGDISALETLQSTNPTQYVIERQKLTDRQTQLNQAREQAIQNYQQQQQELMNQQETERQARLAKQVEVLRNSVEGWKDENVMRAELTDTTDYLLNLGVTQEAIQRISLGMPIVPDALFTMVARKAMLWDKQAKSKPETKKKVVSIGKKVLKAGKAQTKQDKQVGRYKEERAALRKKLQGRNANDALAGFIENHFLNDME